MIAVKEDYEAYLCCTRIAGESRRGIECSMPLLKNDTFNQGLADTTLNLPELTWRLPKRLHQGTGR